ncbi:claudin domain-containing protein 1 isoform X2 [Scleropages formosus]|uniref:claudin domain-containing protein 1 isoform X2 n=1 Tax=Scleropages formosus TaxID=113540 RepID=UPI000878549A|nr:claudin domain-containing protein 1 isoform X2 [Scleropages formosus]
MVDNRYATALVIGSVLSLLATVYLSVAVGTQHWYEYRSPAAVSEANASELRALHDDFLGADFDEKTYSDTLFRLNGTMGLWWRCILVPTHSHWYREPDPKMVTECVSFTLPQQFIPKYREPGNHNSGEDLLRTYLWRPVHSGHSMLLPGWNGPASPCLRPARWSGWVTGMVTLPCPHLLSTAHDGCSPASVGRSQPRSKLLSHDCLQSGVVTSTSPTLAESKLYYVTAYRVTITI